MTGNKRAIIKERDIRNENEGHDNNKRAIMSLADNSAGWALVRLSLAPYEVSGSSPKCGHILYI